jgi:anti-anti-sigma factor
MAAAGDLAFPLPAAYADCGLFAVERAYHAAGDTMSQIQPGNPLEREDFGDVTVLRINVAMLRGDQVTDDLFEKIYSVVEDLGRSRLVLDCGKIDYLASAALARLVTLLHKVRAAGGRLALCKVTRPMEGLLRQSYLTDILFIYENEQEAVRSFG